MSQRGEKKERASRITLCAASPWRVVSSIGETIHFTEEGTRGTKYDEACPRNLLYLRMTRLSPRRKARCKSASVYPLNSS